MSAIATTRTSADPSDCPRMQAAQDASWEKFGNGNSYMRMIEAYAFACRLERELAERGQNLEALMRRCREEHHTPTYADLLAVRGGD